MIARDSTFHYEGQAVDVRQLNRELGARYVLEGSVQRAETSLRVTVQLLDAKDATLLEKSGVEFRVGNAQKALRRTWITSALICGLNPKQVAAHVGHTTTRMVNDVYDSFIDPTSWPEEEERKRLATIFGFDAEGVWARSGHARARKPDLALKKRKSPAELTCRRG